MPLRGDKIDRLQVKSTPRHRLYFGPPTLHYFTKSTLRGTYFPTRTSFPFQIFKAARRGRCRCALLQAGHHFEAREVLDLVDASEWGGNNLELKRLEVLKTLMRDTMSMMLNIEVKR